MVKLFRWLKYWRQILTSLWRLQWQTQTIRRRVGAKAELRALYYLHKMGLQFEAANYFCRQGELDLIMWDDDVLVFVEVRYRQRGDFVLPAHSVNLNKQRKVIRAAHRYLKANPCYRQAPYRFDIVALQGQREICWYKFAFL